MKRYIVFLLVIQMILLAGCTIPFIGKDTEEPSALAEGQDMITLPDTDMESSSLSDAAATSAAGLDTSESPTSETSTGSGIDGSALSGAATGTTDTTGSAIALEGLSAVTGSAVAGFEQEAQADGSTQTGSGTDTGVQADTSVVSSLNTGMDDRRAVTVYYQDRDGFLIPMTRRIPMQQGIARAAVNLCIDSAIAREELAYYGVYPVLPAETEVLGIDIRDGIATIDFDRHFLNYDSAASEKNIIAAVVYTLTEFKTISKVRILVNGYPQTGLKFGSDVSEALGREDIRINSNTATGNTGSGKVDIYLFRKANEGFTYLAPVSVDDREQDGDLPENLVSKLLSTGSTGSMNTEMPDGAELLECSLEYSVLVLNFNKSFTGYGGNAREEGILKQLAYTIRQVDGVQSIRIYVEGRKAELPEGTDISAGLVVPATINDVMDR